MLTIGDNTIGYSITDRDKFTEQLNRVWENLKSCVNTKLNSISSNSVSTPELLLRSALQESLKNFSAFPSQHKALLAKWIVDSDKVTRNKVPEQNSFQNSLSGPNCFLDKKDPKSLTIPHHKYRYWYELALALTGWVQSKQCRQYEKKLAKENYQNIYLNSLIDCLVFKLYSKLMGTIEEHEDLRYPLTMELLSGQTLIRQSYMQQDLQSATDFGFYRIVLNNNSELTKNGIIKAIDKSPMAILKAPGQYHLEDKIAMLLDLSEYLGEHQPWNPQTAGQWLVRTECEEDAKVTTNVIDDCMVRNNSISAVNCTRGESRLLRGIGLSHSSRDESSSSTLIARKFRLSLWGGHSMSVVRVLNTARWAHANKYELTALAQGVAAFWQLSIDKKFTYSQSSKLVYHTLHETMDMAKNFDVNYDLLENQLNEIAIKIDKVDSDYLVEHAYETAREIRFLIKDINKVILNTEVENEQFEKVLSTSNSQNLERRFTEKQRESQNLSQLIEKQVRIQKQHEPNAKMATDSLDTQFQLSGSGIEEKGFQQPILRMLEIEQYLRSLHTQLNVNNKDSEEE